MKVVLQRVSMANVKVDGAIIGEIEEGILILLGIGTDDGKEDIDWLCQKISNLRIFNDKEGVMNLSLKQVGGQALVISQFTLQAQTKKGNRPSYIKAAKGEQAIPLYNKFIQTLQGHLDTEVATGKFGADMKVSLLNDGPVTIVIDSKKRV